MAGGNIDNQLEKISGALALNIDKRIYTSSVWLTMVKKTAWPEEIGHSFETLRSERAKPDGVNTWRKVQAPDGTSTAPCNPPTVNVEFQQNRKTVELATTALQGPPMCVDDLRAVWQRKEQVELAEHALSQVIRNVWIDRYRDSYVTVADYKVVLNPNLPRTRESDGDAFALEPATSKLTNKALDFFYMYLTREGAKMDALTMNAGHPIFALVCSAETSRFLIKEDAATREDFRESSQSDFLLKGMGYTATYNGYMHVIDETPRRATWDGGGTQWIENDPWSEDVTSQTIEQDQDYIDADHEDSIIFVKTVMECLVPSSISNVGKMKFTPQNYIGDIKWLNIPHITDNPDGTIGCYRAVLGSAIRPRQTQYGVVIRHLRCQPDLDLTACV